MNEIKMRFNQANENMGFIENLINENKPNDLANCLLISRTLDAVIFDLTRLKAQCENQFTSEP